MSSVNSATSRNDQNDEVRKLRDEYRKKEAELVKKQNKELASVNQKHTEEMDKSEKQHTNDLGLSKQKNQEAITQRDAKFQKEIEDLRSMHSKQLEKVSQENAQKLDIQRNSSESEAKDFKASKGDREQDLIKKYNQMSAANESKFSEQLGEIRASQTESIDKQKETLTKKHQEEINQLRQERNERVGALQSENHELYQSTAERLKNQDIRHFSDTRRQQDAHMAAMKKQEVQQSELNEVQREGYQDGLRDVRQKFAKVHDQESEMNEHYRNQFHDDVTSRVDNDVNRLSQALNQAKENGVLEETKAKAEAHREVNDIRNAYESKFDILDKARRDTLDESNDRVSQKVKQVHGEADKEMAANTKFYMQQMQLENFKDKTARDQMLQDFAGREKFKDNQHSRTVAKVHSDSLTTEEQLRTNFETGSEIQKQGFEDKKSDIVYTMQKNSNESLARIHNLAEKQEAEHQQTLSTVIGKYEKRIGELNDQLVRERRLRDNHDKQVIKDLTRQHENDIESVRMKYEDRAKQADMSHQNEMKETDRRQQQKLDEVLTSMKKQT